jgi:hypothetical protein
MLRDLGYGGLAVLDDGRRQRLRSHEGVLLARRGHSAALRVASEHQKWE